MIILKCAKCGKMVFVEKKSGCPTMCCGDAMEELIPGSVDAAQEKHVPVLAARGNRVQVTVGSVEHPMLDEHYIQFIILETSCGYQLRRLNSFLQKARAPSWLMNTAIFTACGKQSLNSRSKKDSAEINEKIRPY